LPRPARRSSTSASPLPPNPAGVGEPDAELLDTPGYVAPERITDDAVTPASDVYSLGVLLYKLLTGRLPWTAAGPTDLIDTQLHTEPACCRLSPGVPLEITELCQRCLRKDPASRPTAADVAAMLTAAAATPAAEAAAGTPAPPTTGAGDPSARRAASASPRRRRTRLVVGLLGAMSAAILGWC
jgi:eukaryotic-like serine/threonine-protein kinase